MRVIVTVAICIQVVVNSLYTGEFVSETWLADQEEEVSPMSTLRFIVALELKKTDDMLAHFLDISDPLSPSYGNHLTLQDIASAYGPTKEEKSVVEEFFQSFPNFEVQSSSYGDMIQVTAPVADIESALKTKLSYVKHKYQLSDKKSIRAMSSISIPDNVAKSISFISLNSPVNHLYPRGSKAFLNELEKKDKKNTVAPFGVKDIHVQPKHISISTGNDEVLVHFYVICGDETVNNYNPPCANKYIQDIPKIVFEVTSHANDKKNPFLMDTNPLERYEIKRENIYCYDSKTKNECKGLSDADCICLSKLSPLPKYEQLRVNGTAEFPAINGSKGSTVQLGTSVLFALTDVATPSLLMDLYKMPKGLKVQHGSNQSVAEFYSEFYSNKDLAAFMYLAGLDPNASIPEENVLGDLPNNQKNPGGEAQLDIEYLMALAPGAKTFFYSMADFNPNKPINSNEGFLTYIFHVNSDENPPLVHSLSYGDVEAEIFNASVSGSILYGERCNLEFLKMGLRGLTVLFASGDDGVGSFLMRNDKTKACSRSYPEWPASSPFVTAVGGTQLTNAYLPVCKKDYSGSTHFPDVTSSNRIVFTCTGVGETVCSSTFGGVITTGGGFSNVSDRLKYAPWQEKQVQNFLTMTPKGKKPPLSHFNTMGRGYPDVSTYASNYFIVLNGNIVRESGTSASCPVFAAMVTLWNDFRLGQGLPPLGFINPLLYHLHEIAPEAFQDVVTGNNACGVGGSIETTPCCEHSFGATVGWDAVTGLGSPNFELLSKLIMNINVTYPYIKTEETTYSASFESNYETSEDLENEIVIGRGLFVTFASILILLLLVLIGVLLFNILSLQKVNKINHQEEENQEMVQTHRVQNPLNRGKNPVNTHQAYRNISTNDEL